MQNQVAIQDQVEPKANLKEDMEKPLEHPMQGGLLDLGFDLGDSDSHITPIMIGDEIKTLTAGAHLYHGAQIIMMPFVYPGVQLGKARLRCNVTAAHNRADMGFSLEALAVIGSNLGLLPKGTQTKASTLQKSLWLTETKLRGAQNAGLPFVAAELGQAGSKVGNWAKSLLNGGSD